MYNIRRIARTATRRLEAAMIFILAVFFLQFEAAAFDCSKASPAEKLICKDQSLAKTDQEMDTLYQSQIQNSKEAKAWKVDQIAWLAKRDHCKDDGCLRSEYQIRLAILRSVPTYQWVGHWWRLDRTGNNGSELMITPATPGAFDFTISASAGMNTGDLDGKAIIRTKSQANWRSADQASTGCHLEFELVLNRMEVDGGDGISCGAGQGVSFEGTYIASDKNPNISPDLIELGVLTSVEQDDALRQLTGKDYDTMASAGDIITDGDNLDSNAATVVSMARRGDMCHTSVLMYNAEGHLWAAVWMTPSSQDDLELRYYTNVTSAKSTLPKTISAVRGGCDGDTVRVRMMP